MPQILPRQPTFLEQLGPHLGQIGQAFGGLQRKSAEDERNQALIAKLNDPNTNPMEFATIVSRLPQAQQAAFLPQIKENAKAATAKAGEGTQSQGLLNTLDQLEKDVEYTGARIPFTKAFLRNVPGTESYEKAKQFDASGFLAADQVFTHFNKGTISEAKLKKISEDLAPKSDLFQSENRARIEALRKIMGLPNDVSEAKLDAVMKGEKKAIEKESKKAAASQKKGAEKPSLAELYGS